MAYTFSTILEIEDVGLFKKEQPKSMFFDIKTADGTKRVYLALRSDGALTLKESPEGE